jgi:hypothetical protein
MSHATGSYFDALPLARDLRLKAERALATARELQDHDLDGRHPFDRTHIYG